jgi:hypothetical protein
MATVPVDKMPQTPEYVESGLKRVLSMWRTRLDQLSMFNRALSGDIVIQVPPIGAAATTMFNSDRLAMRIDGSNNLVGAVELSQRTVTAVTRIQATDFSLFCDATAAAFAVYLPAANLAVGRVYCIKKIDATANAVTITAAGTDLIDGAATKALATQWYSRIIQSNGVTGWYILAQL